MKDYLEEVHKVLSNIHFEGGVVKVFYIFPKETVTGVRIVYQQVGNNEAQRNLRHKETVTNLSFKIDIFAPLREQVSNLSTLVDKQMASLTAVRGSSVDMIDNDSDLYHRSLIYRIKVNNKEQFIGGY